MAESNIFDYIKNRANIVDIIGKRINLKKKGAEWVAICPFHDDHNPSMFVSQKKQLYKCFSCGAGGDVFKFVMEYDKLNFKDAAKYLAGLYNIELPSTFSLQKAKQIDAHLSMKTINVWASEMFHHYLFVAKAAQPARDYIRSRRLSQKALKTFKIGFAPDRREFLIRLISEQQLFRQVQWQQASVFNAGKYGIREFFRGRIIFPIFNEKNEVLGFGGRTITNEEPKYLNVRESPWFKKREILYGFKESYERMIKTKEVFVVEGYLDVIGCFEAGIPAVAPLGTALTTEQLTKLRRYVEKVNLFFDGDESGKKAAWRSAELMVSLGMDGMVYTLPPGVDPFDFVKKTSPAERESFLVEQGVNIYRYLIDSVRVNDANWSPVEKKQALEKLIPVYHSINDAMVKESFVDLITRAFSVDFKSVLTPPPSPRQTIVTEKYQQPGNVPLTNLARKERKFVLFLCNHPEFIRSARMVINVDSMEDRLAKFIFKKLLGVGENINFQKIVELFRKTGQEQVADFILNESLKSDYQIAKTEAKMLERDGQAKDLEEEKNRSQDKLQTEFNERAIIIKNEYLKIQRENLNQKIKAARASNEWEKERDFYEQFTALKLEEDKLHEFLNKS